MRNLILLLAIAVCVISCRDLQEKDITKNKVELVSPPDNYRSTILDQTFYWSKVDGASSYRIQIAQNNFFPDSMVLILDSVITKTQITKSLPYGKKFQWRVMPLNVGYEGVFSSPRTIFIDSSATVQFQKVEIRSPQIDNSFTNIPEFNFTWTPLPQAAFYYFSVDSGSPAKSILAPIKLTTTSYSYTMPKDGRYIVTVIGNDNVNSSKNSSRTLNLDRTTPVVILNSPLDKSTPEINDSIVQLSWSSTDKSGIRSNKIFVYTDSLKQNPFKDYNGKVNGSSTENLRIKSGTYTLWWNVESEDNAGNKSSAPALKRFLIQ